MQKRWLGILEILASGITFGSLGLFGKLAYEKGLLAGEFLAARFSLSAALLGFFFLCKKPRALYLPRPLVLRCALLGTAGYALFSSFFFLALERISASLTVLLLYTYPAIVAVGAYVLFRERLGRWQLLSLPLMLLGLFLLVWGDPGKPSSLGLWFGVGSAVFYAVYILASSHWLKNCDSFVAVFYIQLAAAIILLCLHFRPSTGIWERYTDAWPILLGTAVLGSLIPMSLFLSGLKKLKGAEASVLSTAEPLTGVLLAALFLGESLSMRQVLGAVLVLAALIFTSRSKTEIN